MDDLAPDRIIRPPRHSSVSFRRASGRELPSLRAPLDENGSASFQHNRIARIDNFNLPACDSSVRLRSRFSFFDGDRKSVSRGCGYNPGRCRDREITICMRRLRIKLAREIDDLSFGQDEPAALLRLADLDIAGAALFNQALA